MGLFLPTAVRCNCFAHGICAPPPFDPALVVLSAGLWDVHRSGDTKADDALIDAFNAWAETCCEHPSMFAADAAIILSPLTALSHALPWIGDGHWPALEAMFPPAWRVLSGGTGLATPTRDTLAELERFDTRCAASTAWYLIDTDRDARIDGPSYGALPCALVLHGNAGRARLVRDAFEIFIDDETIFRATKLTQQRIAADPDTYLFTNTDTGHTLTTAAHYKAWTERARYEQYEPSNLAVAKRTVDPGAYADTIAGLTRLVRAALDTGNPIAWMR